ncbi:MAG TPA: PorV/PorQ family protein [Rhodothermales bacterium]|nr:PorV/PorQ family protein [Rhodothermales bacterium]
MRRTALLLLALAVPTARAQVLPAFGTDRAGTVGFQFLKLPSDARAIGMGSSGVTTADDASALYWNPALAAQARGAHVAAGRVAYYDGPLFTTNFVGATTPLGSFTLGLSLQTLDSGPMDVTTEFDPDGTGETFRFVDVAVGATVSQALTDLFSYGVTARYVRESTAGLATQSAAADVGIFYRIGTTGARMGVAIKNFGLDASPQGTLIAEDPTAEGGTRTETAFESITMPTTFLLGLSYDAWQRDNHAVVVSAQLARPNDNAESLGLSLEYTFRDVLTLRGGTRFGAGDYAGSAGGSLNVPLMGRRASVDYGFARYGTLGNVHALGLRFGM